LRVKTHLAHQLTSGIFPPGAALPKERELAVALGVAIGTLRQALQELETDGLIRRVRGQGTFATTPDERRPQSRVHLFSLVMPQVRDGLYPSLMHGFEQATANTPYQLSVGNSCNEPMRQEAILRQAIEAGVSGVAIVPTTFPLTPAEQLQPLVDRRIPLVFCHRPVEGIAAPLVTWSGENVGRLTAEALLENGHRKIATIVAYRDPKTTEVMRGIQATLHDRGFDNASYTVRYHGERLPGAQAREAIREVLADLLGERDRPTAIHCANLQDAEQVYLLADEMGFSIPGDLSLIYFGDSRRVGALAQRLTCVAVDAEAIGQTAGLLLMEIAAGERPYDVADRIEVSVRLLPGETVRA
jgi:GntR family transcriptional regulator of arabinose operon